MILPAVLIAYYRLEINALNLASWIYPSKTDDPSDDRYPIRIRSRAASSSDFLNRTARPILK